MKPELEIAATASRFAIAAAIVYFAYQLGQVNSNVGEVTESVDQVSQHIPATLEEVGQVRLEIAGVRQQIPDVLAEVAAVRGQVPIILNEVEQMRQQIPPILAQVDAIEKKIDPILQQVDQTVKVVDKTRRQIPGILATTERAIDSVDATRQQVSTLVPQALEEIRLSREIVDPTLDRVEVMMDDSFIRAQETISSALTAGKEVSEGAVKGFFTGIIKLPFQLVGTLASPITKNISADVAKQMTAKDIELMTAAGTRAVELKKVDRPRRWENPDSGNSGSIEIIRFYEAKGYECMEARIKINSRRRELHDKLSEFCRDDEGNWNLASEMK